MRKSSSKGESWPEGFDKLLDWLDHDRRRAGEKYEEIRQSLIKVFTWRGCSDAEDLADETIDRVVKKVPALVETYQGDPARYFYGVAKYLLLEYQRRVRPGLETDEPYEDFQVVVEQAEERAAQETRHDCLDKCLQTLSPEHKQIIMQYYLAAKTRTTKDMAAQLGLPVWRLRIQVHRIRSNLQRCIEICMKRQIINPGPTELENK
jgi:RNA polymerase sigma factor (sigma-70 family)